MRQAVIFALLLGVIFSACTAWLEYRRALVEIEESVDLIKKIHFAPLSTALWGFDRQQLTAQINGIRNFPHISYVDISKQGEIIVASGSRQERFGRIRNLPLSMVYNGRNVDLGELRFQFDLLSISREIAIRAGRTLLFELVTIFVIVSVFIALVNRQIIRHLTTASSFFSSFSTKNMDTPLILDRTGAADEIDDLVVAFNSMRESLAKAYEQQQLSMQQLQRITEQYRALAELTCGISWEFDVLTDRWNYVAPQAERILGYHPSEWKNFDWWVQHVHPEDREWVPGRRKEHAESGVEHSLEYRFIAADGRAVWISDSVSIEMKDGKPAVMRGVILDITEQKILEDKLLQSQKMEAIGSLAGGVAHDFNNMLMVILGHAELALMKLSGNDKIKSDLEEILRASERSAGLTRQLLAFARKQTIAPKVIDLNDTVGAMLKMLQRLIGEEISLQWHPFAALWPIKADSSQIDQILANLCVNARDAIDGAGTITISSENIIVDSFFCSTHPDAVPGDYVRLSVSDTGKGMSRETLDHIFEPFYTTKELGRGTGLGLSTVYGAVRQNNGFIIVYSEAGKGTTFGINFPRYVAAGQDDFASQLSVAPLGGSETILLVEDEAAIMEITKKMLEEQGYTVVGTTLPSEALNYVTALGGAIDLLITDVIMPEMNGRDLADALTSIYPGCKRLYMSGYTADIIGQHGVLDDNAYFIQKPFSLELLSRKVRDVLAS